MKKRALRRIISCLLTLSLTFGTGAETMITTLAAEGNNTPETETTETTSDNKATSSSPASSAVGIPGRKVGKVIMVTYKDLAAYPGIGVKVKYKKKKKLLEVDRNNIHGQLYIGKKQMLVNNEIKYTLPAAVRLVKQKNGKKLPMLPAKKVGAVLGLKYHYNSRTGRVTYTKKKAKITSTKNLTTKPFMLMSTEEFIEVIGPIAHKDYHKSGILASVTIAQAIHESFAGCSLLAQKGNNLFGMKTYLSGNNWSGSTWKGKSYVKRTREQYGRRVVTITARFRKYDNIMQNINDHSAYFANAKNGRHKRYAGITKTKSYKKQLQIIRKGGYCSFTSYTRNLEKLIKKYHLTRYDR